jgi:predicted HTH domain antitoxin
VVRYNQSVVKTVAIHIPDEVAELLAQDEADLQQELCLLLAVKLYELGRLSAGAAAQLAGLSRPEFLARLSAYQVSPVSLDEEAIEQEITAAHELANRI